MDYQPVPPGKDPQLWQLANKRASFKRHLTTYLIVNGFLWILWYASKNGYNGEFNGMRFPWPVWPMLGWGIGLAFHYIGAYVSTGSSSIDREYDQLIQKQTKQL
jgi:hypothetical protein